MISPGHGPYQLAGETDDLVVSPGVNIACAPAANALYDLKVLQKN